MIMAVNHSGGGPSGGGGGYNEHEQHNRKQNHCEIEKRRRDKMNHYITELASVIPVFKNASSKLDKLTVLRMAVQHVKALRSSLCSFSSFHLRPSFLSSGNLLKNLILQMASLEAQDNLFMVVTCDRAKVLFVSKSSKDILNQEQDELVGQCLFDILHKDDVPKVKEQITHFDLAPNKMLVDSKTLQPIRSNKRQSFIQLQANQANKSATLQPGARRSFFCRMKSGRILAPPDDIPCQRSQQSQQTQQSCAAVGSASSSQQAAAREPEQTCGSSSRCQHKSSSNTTNALPDGSNKRSRDGSSSRQSKLNEERISHMNQMVGGGGDDSSASLRSNLNEQGDHQVGSKRNRDVKCTSDAEKTKSEDRANRRSRKAQDVSNRLGCHWSSRADRVGQRQLTAATGEGSRQQVPFRHNSNGYNNQHGLDSQGGSVSGDSATSASGSSSRLMCWPGRQPSAITSDESSPNSTSFSCSFSPPSSGASDANGFKSAGAFNRTSSHATKQATSSGTAPKVITTPTPFSTTTTTSTTTSAPPKLAAPKSKDDASLAREGVRGGTSGLDKREISAHCDKSVGRSCDAAQLVGGETGGAGVETGVARPPPTVIRSKSSQQQVSGPDSGSSYDRKQWRYIVMHCTGYLKPITLRNDEYDDDDFDEPASEINSDGCADDDDEDNDQFDNDDFYHRPESRSRRSERDSLQMNQSSVLGMHDGGQYRTVNCLVAVCRRSVLDRDLKPDRPLTFTCRYSMEGKFVFVDQRTTLALGYTPQQLMGTSHYAYCHKDSVNTFKECHRQCILKSETVSSDIYQFKRANGQHLWLQTSLKSFRNPWTKIIDYIVANHTTAEGNDPRYKDGCVPTKFNRDMTLTSAAPGVASNELAVGARCGNTGSAASSGSATGSSCMTSGSALASGSSQSPQSSSPVSSSSQISSPSAESNGSCSKKSASPSSSSIGSSYSMESYASGANIQVLLNQIDRVKSGGLKHCLKFTHSKKQRSGHESHHGCTRHHNHNHNHHQHQHHHHHHHHHHHRAHQNCSSSMNRSSGGSSSSGARKSNQDSGNFSDLQSCSSDSSQNSNSSTASADFLQMQTVGNFVEEANAQVNDQTDESVSPPRATAEIKQRLPVDKVNNEQMQQVVEEEEEEEEVAEEEAVVEEVEERGGTKTTESLQTSGGVNNSSSGHSQIEQMATENIIGQETRQQPNSCIQQNNYYSNQGDFGQQRPNLAPGYVQQMPASRHISAANHNNQYIHQSRTQPKNPQALERPRMMNVRSFNGSRPLIAASISIKPLQTCVPYQYSYRPPPILPPAHQAPAKSSVVEWQPQQPPPQRQQERRQQDSLFHGQTEERSCGEAAGQQSSDMCDSMSASRICNRQQQQDQRQQQQQQQQTNYIVQQEPSQQQQTQQQQRQQQQAQTHHDMSSMMQMSSRSSNEYLANQMNEVTYTNEAQMMHQQYMAPQMSDYQLSHQHQHPQHHHHQQAMASAGHHMQNSTMTMTINQGEQPQLEHQQSGNRAEQQQQQSSGGMVPMIWNTSGQQEVTHYESHQQSQQQQQTQQQQVALMSPIDQCDGQLMNQQHQQHEQHLMLDQSCPQCSGHKCCPAMVCQQQAPYHNHHLMNHNHNNGDLNSMHLSSLVVDDLDENELLECLADCDPEAQLYNIQSNTYPQYNL